MSKPYIFALCSCGRHMGTETTEETQLSRSDAAARLRTIAVELDSEENMAVDIENKTITLRPPEMIDMEIGVHESSSVLQGEQETLTVTLSWSPVDGSE